MRASLVTNLLLSRFGVLGAVASFFGVFWFVSGKEYVWAGGTCLVFVLCLLAMKTMVENDRREIRQMIASLRQFESLRFEEACAKAAEGSVPIAGELARMREFSSPPPSSPHRYFERDEIVFRVEETPEGFARFVFQKSKNA